MRPQDGKALSLDGPDPEMTEVQIPTDFLNKTYIGRCSKNSEYACAPPGGQYTDLNIWDSFLDTEQLLSWTRCRCARQLYASVVFSVS